MNISEDIQSCRILTSSTIILLRYVFQVFMHDVLIHEILVLYI